jgi:hypothetical protein
MAGPMKYKSLEDFVGNTPLVRLKRCPEPTTSGATT